MTRDEEIRKAAGQVAIRDNKGHYAHGFLMQALREAFTEGARWADEHPKMAEGLDDCSREDLLGLIEFYKRALDVQGKTMRQLVIDKVCRWLQENTAMLWDSPCNPDRIVEQFKQAMQDESE